jgi:hypothetical protein
MNNYCKRLLIANHIDPSLLKQKDQRTFTQRIFWLAKEGDLILVSSEPDTAFLDHVCENLRIKKELLNIICISPNNDDGRIFDPRFLISVDLINRLKPITKKCEEVICLWPSVQVADLVINLGLEHCFEGTSFFKQGGDALVNSKASFRALAAALSIPIPQGTVCRTSLELSDAIEELIKKMDGVMIKQSFNGAAAGCTVITSNSNSDLRPAGSIWTKNLSELADSIPNLWHWASVNDRFPVIVEELKIGYQTIWFEFESKDLGVKLSAIGSLEYEKGKLLREHTPLKDSIDEKFLNNIKNDATKLAQIYHTIGYRGILSADGLINNLGNYCFTEMNARIGGSLPIYGGVWERVVKQNDNLNRHIIQYLTPPDWPDLNTNTLIHKLNTDRLLYNPLTRTGALIGIPPKSEIGSGNFLIILVTESENEQKLLFDEIAKSLNSEDI